MENTNKSQLITMDTSHTIVERQTQTSSQNNQADIILALNALDGIYKSNINSYAQSIHACTRDIEDAKNRLEHLEQEIAPENLKLQATQKEIDYELRTLERFTQEWNEVSTVILALEEELSQLDHSQTQRDSILKGRKNALEKLAMDIEDTELKLLEQELEKQNITLAIAPVMSEISALTLRIQQLQNEKHYIESSHLHKIAPLTNPSNTPKAIDAKPIEI